MINELSPILGEARARTGTKTNRAQGRVVMPEFRRQAAAVKGRNPLRQ
jgi:hypothetical protein